MKRVISLEVMSEWQGQAPIWVTKRSLKLSIRSLPICRLCRDWTYIHAIVVDLVLVGHSIEFLIAFVQSVWRMSFHFFDMQPKAWGFFVGPEFDQPIAQGN